MADGFPLPGQAGATYLDIQIIRQEISSLTATSPEDQLYGVWNSILLWMFPAAAEYFIFPQSYQNVNGETHHVYEFYTVEHVDGARKPVLLTHCIPDESEGVWMEAATRLGLSLRECLGSRPEDQRNPVYGAISVGRRVMFFKYEDEGEGIIGWRPSPDLTSCYDLEHNAPEIQEVLNYIREEH